MKEHRLGLIIILILTLLHQTKQNIGFSILLAGTSAGGQSSSYTFLFYATGGVSFPVSTQSVRITFPSPEYSISPQTFTTEILEGFTAGAANPESKATASNSLYVNLNQANKTNDVISFKINGIVNTIFQTVTNKFQAQFYDSVGGVGNAIGPLLESSFVGTFVPPDITSVKLSLASNVVFTESEMNVELRVNYRVIASSLVLVDIPEIYTGARPVDKNTVACEAVAGIDAGLSCTFDDSLNVLTVTGGFPAEVTPPHTATFKIRKFKTPVSTSPVASFNFYIANSAGNKYMKTLNKQISVSQPREFSGSTVVVNGANPGKSALILAVINFAAYVDQTYSVKFTSDGGVDYTNSQLPGFDNFAARTATELWMKPGTQSGMTAGEFPFTVQNVLIRNWVQDSVINIYVYDGNDNIAQQTLNKVVQIKPNTLTSNRISISANPTTLGSKSTLTLQWRSLTQYSLGTKAFVTTPTNLVKGTPACSIPEAGGTPTCTLTSHEITVAGAFTTTKPADTTYNLAMTDFTLPYCASDLDFTLVTKINKNSADRLIDQGTTRLASTVFTVDALNLDPVGTTNKVGAELNTINVKFTHSSILKQASVFTITLHNSILWVGGSQCNIVSGVSGTCVREGLTNIFKIMNGLPSADKAPGAIEFQFQSVVNPRAKGTYTIGIVIATNSPVCDYASGTASFTIDSDLSITATLVPTLTNRNLFSKYTAAVIFTANQWVNNDYVMITLPVGMTSSPTVVCKGVTENLVSISCALSSATKLKVLLSVDSAKYSANKRVEFEIEFLQNPDSAGATAGFFVELMDQNDNRVYIAPEITITYSNYISQPTISTNFPSNLKGDAQYVGFTLSSPAFFPKDVSKLQIKLVDPAKWEVDTAALTVRSSSPALTKTTSTVPTARRRLLNTAPIYLAFDQKADVNPGDTVALELDLRNPITNTISNSDIELSMFINDKLVFKSNALSEQLLFLCSQVCLTCGNYFNICTSCQEPKVLGSDTCSDPPPVEPETQDVVGTSFPFLFTLIALVTLVVVVIITKCWSKRNFVANYYLSLLKIIHFCAYFGTLAFYVINKEPTVFIVLFCLVIFIHLIISCMSARSFMWVYKRRTFEGCTIEGPPRFGQPHPSLFQTVTTADVFSNAVEQLVAENERRKKIEKLTKIGKEKEKSCLFRTMGTHVMIGLFNCQVTRMFFSTTKQKILQKTANGKQKWVYADQSNIKQVAELSLFWTWDQNSFFNLRRSYSKYRNYELIVHFLAAAVLIASTFGFGIATATIYLFKFDIIGLILIDAITYTLAYNEIYPKKKGKATQKPKKKLTMGDLKKLVTTPIKEDSKDKENLKKKEFPDQDDSVLVKINLDEDDLTVNDEQVLDKVVKDGRDNVIGERGDDGVIRDEEGNTVEIDEHGNFIFKDKNDLEKVLKMLDKDGYPMEIDEKGNKIVKDEFGNVIKIIDKEDKEHDKKWNPVTYDKDENRIILNKNGEEIARFNKKEDLINEDGEIIMERPEFKKLETEGFWFDQKGRLYNPKQRCFYDPEKKLKYRLDKDGEKLFIEEDTGRLFRINDKGEKIFFDPDTEVYYKEGPNGIKKFCDKNGKLLTKKQIRSLLRKGKLIRNDKGKLDINKDYASKVNSYKSKLVLGADGIYRPMLIQKEDPRNPGKRDPNIDKKLANSAKNGRAKSKKFDDVTEELGYNYHEDDTSNKMPTNLTTDDDLARRNAKFNKWWFTADKNYLEVINEEDEELDELYENPEYDDKEKDRMYNNPVRPDGLKLAGGKKRWKLIEPGSMDQFKAFDERYKASIGRNQVDDNDMMEGVKLGTAKNGEMKNTSEGVNQDPSTFPRAFLDRNGYFIATNGKKYIFDQNHNMLTRDRQVVPLFDVPKLIQGLNVDNVPNIPRKYTSPYPRVSANEKGEFLGLDNKKHRFNEAGHLLDEDGTIIPYEQSKDIIYDMNVDHIKNCPNKYRLDLVKPIVNEYDQFHGADAELYKFSPDGDLYDTEGRMLSEEETKKVIDGLNIDFVPNCPLKYKLSPVLITPRKGGKFEGNDGKFYMFDQNGNLLDSRGRIVDPENAQKIVNGLNLDGVPNVPDHYKTDIKKPTLDEEGYFVGADNKKYKFDSDGNLVDKEGNIIPKEEVPDKIKGLNLDHMENTPNEYRLQKKLRAPIVQRDGSFLGADGKNYKFNRRGQLIDENGNVVSDQYVPFVLDGIMADNIPNCPPHLKTLVVPKFDHEGYFKSLADGKSYKFDTNGDLVDKKGKPVPYDQIHKILKGIDFRLLPGAPLEAKHGDPRFSTAENPYGVIEGLSTEKIKRAQSRFRESDFNFTRLGSVTMHSQKDKIPNTHLGDTNTLDFGLRIEDIDHGDYPSQQMLNEPFSKSTDPNDDQSMTDGRNTKRTENLVPDNRLNSANTLTKPKKRRDNLLNSQRAPSRIGKNGGPRDSLASTLKGDRSIGGQIPFTNSRRKGRKSAGGNGGSRGISLKNKRKKKKRRRDSTLSAQKMFRPTSQMQSRRRPPSGVNFFKQYKRKKFTKTMHNFNDDKLRSLRQIYIDDIEKEKKRHSKSRLGSRAGSRMQSRRQSRTNLHTLL